MTKRTCSIDGCGGPHHAKGYCVTHYTQGDCGVNGCGKPARIRGWCPAHYKRFRLYGSPTGKAQRATPEQRFLAKVNKDAPNGCWEWTAHLDKAGYGRFNPNRSPVFAHRWSYQQWVGDLPADLAVCHRCDNPRCVNPDHLFLGSQADNMQDAFEKGRISGQKLTPEIHAEIRARYSGRPGEQKVLAEEYGVTAWTISYILNGHRWKKKS